MKRLSILAVGIGAALLPAGSAHAMPGVSSFTPESFVMPIYSIMLARGLDVNIPIYSCTPDPVAAGDAGVPSGADAGAPHDCMVDMADEAALAALFSAPADIPPGTYDSIVVMTCAAGDTSFVAKTLGTIDLEGTTNYTTSGVPAISTNLADKDYASINYAGCGNTVKLAPPVTVSEGDTVTVNAFFTLQNLSWVLGNSSPGLGGCAVVPGGDPNVCSGLPVLVGYVGSAAPTLDAYYITENQNDLTGAEAAGQVLFLSAGGEPFSGFLRRVYSHDSIEFPSVSYDVPLRDITRNTGAPPIADAGELPDAAALDDAGVPVTYDVYAIGDPFQDLTKYRVRFPYFQMRDHNGTLWTANGTDERPYRAVKR